MGYANSREGLVLGDGVLTVRSLNLMMELCCLSNKTRKKDDKIASEERKWE